MISVIKNILALIYVFCILVPIGYVIFTILWPFQYFFKGKSYRKQTELNLLHNFVKNVTKEDIVEFIFQ